jgi:RimJ/RimL family protein N-acetyltransferase
MSHKPTLTIRSTTIEDAELVLYFIKEIAAYEKLSEHVIATVETIKQSIFIDHHAEVFIASVNDQPIGFALIYYNYSSFLAKAGMYLEDIYINPEHRNHGYGLEILSFLAKLAIERNISRMEWSVLNWNEPSIAFYKKLNAFAMDEWSVYRLQGESLLACSKNK